MRLKSSQITNFKCIEDSGTWRVAPVTCLVGKNESGKTAILQALYKLNPYYKEDADFDKISDYPRRHLTEYDTRHGGKDARVIETIWKLEDADIRALDQALGPGLTRSDEVVVWKGYDNHRHWDLQVDEEKAISHLVKQSGLNKAEKDAARKCRNLNELRNHLEELGQSRSDRQSALAAAIQQKYQEKDVAAAVAGVLQERMPKFLYFSQYDRMPGQISLEETSRKQSANELTEDDRVFLAFLGLVGTSLEQLMGVTTFEPLIAQLEAASIRISEEIFNYWSQNRHLKVQVRIDAGLPGDSAPFNTGRVARIRVENSRHAVTVRFDERSTGFVWFFSFLVLFSQVKKTHGDDVIILLDEPGLSLHAKAQADLLRYINEKLRPHNQVIYTTHSPFMVDVENLLGTRTVEDLVETDSQGGEQILGTKIGDDVLSTDRDTLFPLQGALGYDITQSLFVGRHTLLVEGPADLLYLTVMRHELHSRQRLALDRRWTICPVGGVDKVAAFVSLFGGNKLDLAILIDYTHGRKGAVERLRQSKLLFEGRVVSADTYAGQPEADIEDIIGRPAYVALVNQCYGLVGQNRIPDDGQAPSGERILDAVERHFQSLPSGSPEFNHYEPALFLMENRERLFRELPGIEAALERFERLFSDLNGLLAESARA